MATCMQARVYGDSEVLRDCLNIVWRAAAAAVACSIMHWGSGSPATHAYDRSGPKRGEEAAAGYRVGSLEAVCCARLAGLREREGAVSTESRDPDELVRDVVQVVMAACRAIVLPAVCMRN